METQKRRFQCGTLMIKSGLWWCYWDVHIEVKRELRWCFPILPYFLVHGLLDITSTSQQCWKPLCRSFVSFCVPETMWLMLQFNSFSLDRAVQLFSYLVSCFRLNKNRVRSKFTTYINPSIICDDSRFKYWCGLKLFVWPCEKRISKVAHTKMIHLSSAGKTNTSIKSSGIIR